MARHASQPQHEPPWVDSDSWYTLSTSPPQRFFNCRTGLAAGTPPDGLRRGGGGERLGSAPCCGWWAVPSTRPRPTLPANIAPGEAWGLASAAAGPEHERWGAGHAQLWAILLIRCSPFPFGRCFNRTGRRVSLTVASTARRGPLFSAPHGVYLSRDGKPDHLPEDFTTYLCRAWAAAAGGRSLTWNGTPHIRQITLQSTPRYMYISWLPATSRFSASGCNR